MATMWLTAGLLMPAILEASKPNTEFLAFLASVGVILVDAVPNFKEADDRKTMIAVACGISRVENGTEAVMNDVRDGWNLL